MCKQIFAAVIKPSRKNHITILFAQQKDFAVRLICSPEPVEDEASEEDEEPKEKKIKTPQKPENMADSDERWIATHARQVNRMLPGGLDVLGIFALAPPNMMISAQTKLRQSAFKPADWKPQSGSEKWIKLKTDINLDLKINVPVKQQNQNMLKQIQTQEHLEKATADKKRERKYNV
ncbi:unnamed protein product [Mytilus edulis]|uniref:Uncharacterized protein n=1 Tax=Mytilus edulis TaxID=6550 RepID=A0A8S3RB19_MYTED|nr:unnamed protein product [Mytilus edulis]